MKINFENPPFSSAAFHIRGWLEQIVDDADLSSSSKLWWMPLPPGSTTDDATTVSACLLALFPEESAAAEKLCTPVAVEFLL